MPKTIGVRKLRGYAASMGGTAELFSDADTFADAIKDLSNPLPTIAIVDSRVPIKPELLADISKVCNLIYVDSDSTENADANRAETSAQSTPLAPDILLSAYVQYPIQKFFFSQAIRIAIYQICGNKGEFSLDCFTRWGGVSTGWKLGAEESISEVQRTFINKYKLQDLLPESPQKLASFLENELPKDGWSCEQLQIRTDGVVFSAVARCIPQGKDDRLDLLASKLSHISSIAINTLPDGSVEIANIMELRFDGREEEEPKMLLVFNGRTLEKAERETEELGTAV